MSDVRAARDKALRTGEKKVQKKGAMEVWYVKHYQSGNFEPDGGSRQRDWLSGTFQADFFYTTAIV